MTRTINIIGSIDWESFKEFSEQMNELEKKKEVILIHLASDGGEVHPALAFSSRIRLSPCAIKIIAYGNCSSAASLILTSGHLRQITRECWVMVHQDTGETTGELHEREREIKQDRRLEDQWNTLMEKNTSTSKEEWAKLNRKTTYLTAEDCLKLGLVDEII